MKTPINKYRIINDVSGTLRVSIPNMITTITQLEEGDSFLYKMMEYNQDEDELILSIKIKRKEDDKSDNLPDTIQ